MFARLAACCLVVGLTACSTFRSSHLGDDPTIADVDCLRAARANGAYGHYLAPAGLLEACKLKVPDLDGDINLQHDFAAYQMPFIAHIRQPGEGKVWSLCYTPDPTIVGILGGIGRAPSTFACRSLTKVASQTKTTSVSN